MTENLDEVAAPMSTRRTDLGDGVDVILDGHGVATLSSGWVDPAPNCAATHTPVALSLLSGAANALGRVTPQGSPVEMTWVEVFAAIRELREESDRWRNTSAGWEAAQFHAAEHYVRAAKNDSKWRTWATRLLATYAGKPSEIDADEARATIEGLVRAGVEEE